MNIVRIRNLQCFEQNFTRLVHSQRLHRTSNATLEHLCHCDILAGLCLFSVAPSSPASISGRWTIHFHEKSVPAFLQFEHGAHTLVATQLWYGLYCAESHTTLFGGCLISQLDRTSRGLSGFLNVSCLKRTELICDLFRVLHQDKERNTKYTLSKICNILFSVLSIDEIWVVYIKERRKRRWYEDVIALNKK